MHLLDRHGHEHTRDNPPSTHPVKTGEQGERVWRLDNWTTARDNPPTTHPVTQGDRRKGVWHLDDDERLLGAEEMATDDAQRHDVEKVEHDLPGNPAQATKW